MNEFTFWKLIDAANQEAGGDPEQLVQSVQSRLEELPPAEIESFNSQFRDRLDNAYHWDLWGAAYVILGGCSDDGFEYFRCWLIGQGRSIYDSAVMEPDTLSDIVNPNGEECENESLLYAAIQSYERITGRELPRSTKSRPHTPMGDNWDFDDPVETSRRLLSTLQNFQLSEK